MSWAEPSWFLALAGVVALAVLIVWAGWRHQRAVRQHFTGRLLERVLPRHVRVRRASRDLLALLGLVGVVAALAEPRFGKEIIEIRKQGVDIVLAVDLSRSMDAEDVDPSRLERARREILDLIEMLEGDRVGLVIFSGGAYPRMPLTNDHDALRLLVRELDTSTFQHHGSELGAAIRTSLQLLQRQSEDAGKAVIVLSDGEIHSPEDALAAAREASKAGVHVFGLGIGQDAAPIPMGDGSWLEHEGRTVLTTPSAAVLRDVARVTGGAYVQSVASAEDMSRLYRQEIRGQVQAADRGTLPREVWQSGFQWPLAFGVFCWLLAAWLGDGRWRRGVALGALLLLVSPMAHAGDLADGDAAYRAGRYGEAVEIFTKVSLEKPTDPEVFQRLGAARYRTGDFEGAARAYDTWARLGGAESAAAEFDAGNAHYRSGRLEEALDRYDRVLEQDPGHPGAAHNKDMVLRELEIRRQQKQKPPPQGGEGGDGSGSGDDDQEGSEGSEGDQQSDGEGQGEQPSEGASGDPSESQESADQGSDAGEQGERDGTGQDLGEQGEDGSVSPGEVDEVGDGGGEGDGAQSPSEEPGGEGPVTEGQAERLLEGVEEGRPRIVIRGDAGDKPW